jgi:HK97 family phage major capsid protein
MSPKVKPRRQWTEGLPPTAATLAKSRELLDAYSSKPRNLDVSDYAHRVTEPDAYQPGTGGFLLDLRASYLQGNKAAKERLRRHHEYELERRVRNLPEIEKAAITSSTLGGIIPPAYLVDTYAKASRNGRVYADQVSGLPLPAVGMVLTVPRFTAGFAAAVQATENTAVTTADPTEADLSVPVRSIGGYSPVSFQALERQEMTEEIIVEDLTARYFAALDTQCISGSGSSGQLQGVLGTSGIATSAAASASGPVVLSKIEDCCQQIENALLGVAGVADKIVMHPRRWRWLCALSDTTNVRPFVLPDTDEPETSGASPGYVGKLANLSVYIDANIPTNLGAGTNEDRIIVFVSSLVNLWEVAGGPMTFRFDQQNATALQAQLVVEGQVAFTAGRFPLASGVVTGPGLVTPVFP